MSTGKEAEWTIHTSCRSKRPATPEASKPTPEPAASKPKPTPKPEPATGTIDDTESIASADSSMTDNDRHTKTVKDFVPATKLVPITNQVTSNDVITFQQVMSDSLARMSSRYTDEVALKGGYEFPVLEKELNYKIRLNDPTVKLPIPQKEPVRPIVETSIAVKKYYSEMRSFRLEYDCNLDVRALLDEKFPGILNPIKH
mmetsp:Transcript_12913/g.27236  ORF Transcript_12913/g.27236 Transcript_12913/m.27236 type:complete len:200 (-) Transcript_12913:502-1101(-)